MVWYFLLLKYFPQFVVIHSVIGFSIVNEAEVDVFVEFSCSFYDPADVGNYTDTASYCRINSILCICVCHNVGGFPAGSVLKNPAANAGGSGSIPGSGRSPEGGNGDPCQYSCLGNPMKKGAWRATIHEVARELEAI